MVDQDKLGDGAQGRDLIFRVSLLHTPYNTEVSWLTYG